MARDNIAAPALSNQISYHAICKSRMISVGVHYNAYGCFTDFTVPYPRSALVETTGRIMSNCISMLLAPPLSLPALDSNGKVDSLDAPYRQTKPSQRSDSSDLQTLLDQEIEPFTFFCQHTSVGAGTAAKGI